MWTALLVTVIAAAGNNIGKVLQKKGTNGLPRLKLDRKILWRYITTPMWAAGLAADVAGALLMIRAVSLAPVSVVQPVSCCGLAILALFSHFYLEETMQPKDWLAISLAAVGTIGIGLTAEDEDNPQVSLFRLLVSCIALGSLLGSIDVFVLHNGSGRRKPADAVSNVPLSPLLQHHNVLEEIGAGIQAGALFGLSAGVCRTGLMLARRGALYLVFAPLGIASSVALSSIGFYCQTRGLREGRAVIVSTCTAVAAMLAGVLVGLFALGEHLPTTHLSQALLFSSWCSVTSGMVLLIVSNDPRVTKANLRGLMGPSPLKVPHRARSVSLPTAVAESIPAVPAAAVGPSQPISPGPAQTVVRIQTGSGRPHQI